VNGRFSLAVRMLPCDARGKGKRKWIYVALFFVAPHTRGAQAWITQFYLQLDQCLPLPRKCSPDGTSTD